MSGLRSDKIPLARARDRQETITKFNDETRMTNDPEEFAPRNFFEISGTLVLEMLCISKGRISGTKVLEIARFAGNL